MKDFCEKVSKVVTRIEGPPHVQLILLTSFEVTFGTTSLARDGRRGRTSLTTSGFTPLAAFCSALGFGTTRPSPWACVTTSLEDRKLTTLMFLQPARPPRSWAAGAGKGLPSARHEDPGQRHSAAPEH